MDGIKKQFASGSNVIDIAAHKLWGFAILAASLNE
jgi:hypothetical protein